MASCKRPAGRPRNRPRASSSAVLLLGRKTYEIFAAYWSYYDEDASHGSIAKLFNDIKKYAVSRSGEVDTMKRLKQEDGPNLVTQGSSELVHALLADDLVLSLIHI